MMRQVLNLTAAAAVGAGLTVVAHRLRVHRTSGDKCTEGASPEDAENCSFLLHETMHAMDASGWGSPVLRQPQDCEGNKTLSPSKLPRPRKLFSDCEGDGEVALVDYQLKHMLKHGALRLGSRDVELDRYVQPASIDLPISGTVYLVKEKVLPFRKQVRQLVEELLLEDKALTGNGAVLLKGQTYLVYCGKVRGVVDGCGLYDIVPGDGQERELWLEISPRSFNVRVHEGTAVTQLMLFMSPHHVVESGLPLLHAAEVPCHHAGLSGSSQGREHQQQQREASSATPKSPLHNSGKDRVLSAVTVNPCPCKEQGWQGETAVREEGCGMERNGAGGVVGPDESLQESLQELEARICYDTDGKVLPLHLHKGALVLSVCIPDDASLLAGYEAVATEEVIDLTRIHGHDPSKFFRPIFSHSGNTASARLTLEKDRFYILATKERVSIPVHLSAEMVPFSHHVGELRAHYAGFFDPGFGFGADGNLRGSIGVLEVRPHETINIYHGQPICLMEFFRNASVPMLPYGSVGSNYQGQSGPQLAKYFSKNPTLTQHVSFAPLPK